MDIEKVLRLSNKVLIAEKDPYTNVGACKLLNEQIKEEKVDAFCVIGEYKGECALHVTGKCLDSIPDKFYGRVVVKH